MNDVRTAKADDLQAIVEIYNQAVRSGFETADTAEVSIESMRPWFDSHEADKYPILVHEQSGLVTGWISTSPYRQGRKAVQHTAEISYYVSHSFKRRGIGQMLITACIDQNKRLGFKSLFAVIIDGNDASRRLLQKFGFNEWARLPKVVEFNGVQRDHVYYGLKIAD